MTRTVAVHGENRPITNLTLHEIDMIYSLARIGDWSSAEIGRKYKISATDAGKVFDNYVELREMLKRNPQVPQDPLPELTKKLRKPRRDARYQSAAERQAAYRARLKEKRHAATEQPSPNANTDTPIPAVEDPSVTACEAPVPEIGTEDAETQHSACYGSSLEGCDISEGVPASVTPEACNERE